MDRDELWNKTLKILLDGVSTDDVKSVFLNFLKPLDCFNNYFLLLAENAQVESWVKRNYLTEIEQTLTQVSGTSYHVRITSSDDLPTTSTSTTIKQENLSQKNQTSSHTTTQTEPINSASLHNIDTQPEWMNIYVKPSDLSQIKSEFPNAQKPISTSGSHKISSITQEERALFSKCSFETFVVGKSNEFARGASLAVAEQPGVAYNPLFIYGSSGLGKTHLLVAIANYIIINLPQLITVYVSANKFLNDFVTATQHHDWAPFNQRYHQADILLIDDVQYLEGRDETVNQLFNIFNEMTNQNKQIVLSADRAPKDIDMDDRMRSRFVSGLLADIKPPDYETRLAILKNYLARVEETTPIYVPISNEILNYLASESSSNIREIEGAINRLVGYITLGRRSEISLDEAQEILQDYLPDTSKKQISISIIQSEVEHYFNISHEDMISSKRNKNITQPRHIAIYLARYLTEESLENIGKKFGGRDHTTIMHSVNKIEKEQKDNRLLFDQIDKLTIKIKEQS